MTQRAVQQAGKAAKTSAVVLKKAAVAVTRAASALVSALAGIVGGGILLMALVVVVVIAAIANSPFGLFFAQEPNAPDTVSVAQAVGTVNMAYNSRLELLQAGDYDTITLDGQAPDWAEVLAVFAVRTAGADVDGLDVATLDPDRVSKLTAVFWDMTGIAVSEDTIDHPASGTTAAWTEKILHITITPKTADDMRVSYGFSEYQNSALDELLSDRDALTSLAGSLAITSADVREVLAALPDNLDPARREAVQTALQLVGKVNYFWGGKSRAIGWDSRWGQLTKVWAAGSSSTGFSSIALDPAHSNTAVSIHDIVRTTIETADGQVIVLDGYLDIGIIDTMKDLFVNFLGAAIFSTIGYFYAKKHKRSKFVQQFIPQVQPNGDD